MPDRDPLEAFADLDVRARGRLFAVRPGRHRSRGLGTGGAFATLVSLLDHPDPRRIDVRASLADPFETVLVRRHRQAVAAKVVVILDTSGSMTATGRVDRSAVARLLVAGFARAVERSSDAFGLLTGAADGEAVWPPARRRGLAAAVAATLAGTTFTGDGLDRLDAAIARLPAGRAVVFLVSDFTQPLAWLAERLDRLAGHDVRPIVLRDTALEAPDPRFGLVELADLERRRKRLVLMRPSLARRWQEAAAARRAALGALFDDHDCAAFDVVDQIDVERLLEALLETGGRA
ncbi:VWA domain-containing protein [Mongoliimonas terrestris]|uniref:DUF58 domain-containing protein n=1 Tax=Mongoliimonas terrestris TaxID=1709001 RepID=UPI0009495C5F|nr:VWA domain-containing protein [Mongoliimonas terrestris]